MDNNFLNEEDKISKEYLNRYNHDRATKLADAVSLTYSKYSENQIKIAVYYMLTEGKLNYFTNECNARTKLMQEGVSNIQDTAINEYINIVMGKVVSKDPLEEAIKRTYEKYKNEVGIDAYGNIEKILKGCLEGKEYKFTRDGRARENLEEYVNREGKELKEIIGLSIAKVVVGDILQKDLETEEPSPISKVNIYSNNIEQLRSAIISGTGIKREGTVSLGRELQACTSIGKIRKNQEDAVLLIEHPQNPEFKMMVVADGMGGLESGEYASNFVVKETEKWFKSLDLNYYSRTAHIYQDLNEHLQVVSNKLYNKKGGRCGSTFVGAIIGKDETVVVNVGDSRAYIVNNQELTQVTEDQSLVNDMYNRGEIILKDHMRFHKKANVINQYLGIGVKIEPDIFRIENKDFNSIILLSDGVTDCLSDEQILVVTKTTDRSKLAEMLVKKALDTNSVKPGKLDFNNYNGYIQGGKDNTTAAVFTKDKALESLKKPDDGREM